MIALGALAAAPVAAQTKQDFVACDGRVHPGKQDDGMRGPAGTSGTFGLSLFGGDVVGACTRALGSPRLLPTQALRRAHLLRARAAAHLRAGEIAKANEDLDAAEAATSGLATDPFFRRSMGVSFMLLRAIAKAHSGDLAAAVPLARTAMNERPYALQVQEVGAAVLQAARPTGAGSASPWTALSRLAPSFAATALIEEAQAGNFAGVLALRSGAEPEWPTERVAPLALATRDEGATKLLAATMTSLHVAYARATTGDPAGAKRDLAEVRSRVAALRPEAATGALPLLTADLATGLDKYVDARARQIEARVAVAEGRPSDAIAALIAAPMPKDAATVDLLKALKLAMPAKEANLVPDVGAFAAASDLERRKALTAAVSAALIAPETPRAVVDYERSRPNVLGALIGGALSMGTSLLGGIDRLDGFRSTANPDGTIRVEFIGNSPSMTLIQEMTLLRAAEVAHAAGKPAFVVIGRKDYSRRMTMTQYGREISSVPTGYKSELTIRPMDADAAGDRGLNAMAIIDALGPLYYEKKPTPTPS